MSYFESENDLNENEKKLSEMKKNISEWYGYFARNYELGRQDKHFLLVEQWDSQDLEDLVRLQIPILRFNKLYDIVKKIISQQRENTPNIQVRAKNVKKDQDDEQLQDTLNIVENIVRSIGYDSKTTVIYQNVFQNLLQSGYGAIQVLHDYEGPKTFNQKIYVEEISIPEQAFFDVQAINSSKTDGRFAGRYKVLDRETYDALYPDFPNPVSMSPEQYTQYFSWTDYNGETVVIVDYYEKEFYEKTLLLLEDNQTVDEKEYKELVDFYKKNDFPIPNIVDKRVCNDYKIMHYRLTENYILECKEFPSHILPIVFVDGDSFIADGQQRTQSFIRHAIDTQKFLNYTGVAIAQAIKNARKESFIGTPDNIKGNEQIWKNPERFQGILIANPDRKTGALPQKIPPSEVPQSLYVHYNRASADIQSILGFYNANLGAPTDEVSGVAISNKIKQGNNAVFVYQDNLMRGIEEVGRIILSMLPRIYDNERMVQALKQDGTSSQVLINSYDEAGNPINHINGIEYDIEINVGPTYQLQKERSIAVMTQFANMVAQAEPDAFKALLPKIAANLELENTPQIVDILNTFVPDNIKAIESGQPLPRPAPPPPDPMVILQNQKMQIEQQKVNNARQELALKQQAQMTDAQLKERQMMFDIINDARKTQLEELKTALGAKQVNEEIVAKHLATLAEIHKAELDLESNKTDAMASVFKDLTSKMPHSRNESVSRGNDEFNLR